MESKTLQSFQFNSSPLKSEQLLEMKEAPVKWNLKAGLGLVKNLFQELPAKGLHVGFVHEFRH